MFKPTIFSSSLNKRPAGPVHRTSADTAGMKRRAWLIHYDAVMQEKVPSLSPTHTLSLSLSGCLSHFAHCCSVLLLATFQVHPTHTFTLIFSGVEFCNSTLGFGMRDKQTQQSLAEADDYFRSGLCPSNSWKSASGKFINWMFVCPALSRKCQRLCVNVRVCMCVRNKMCFCLFKGEINV